jgi:phosphopantetheine adenylyltransferase
MDMEYLGLLVLVLSFLLFLFFWLPLSNGHKELLTKASFGVASANEVARRIILSPDSRAYRFRKYKAEVVRARQRYLVMELIKKI